MEKICTSLVQSYNLLKLKFDARTADMCWATGLFGESFPSWKVLCISSEEYRNIESKWTAVPAWSLSALTELVTSGLKSSDIKLNFCKSEQLAHKNKRSYHVRCTFNRVASGRTWQDGRYTNIHGELLDAMFELVCLMKKESLL